MAAVGVALFGFWMLYLLFVRDFEAHRGSPLVAEGGVASGEALGPRPALRFIRVAREAIFDGREQRGQRQRGVGRDREVHRGERLERLRPAPDRVVVERDRDHPGVFVQQTRLARAPVGVAERAEEA